MLIGGIALMAGGVFFSIPVEVVSDPPPAFDIQIVLGGNTRERSEISEQLWEQHPTPILVTGDGGYTLDELQSRGLKGAVLLHEKQATNTWENAYYSIPMLKERGDRSVVIVTSSYHSARALSCFRKLGPEIEFLVATSPSEERAAFDSFQLRFRERGKRLAYAVVHGISPWSSSSSTPAEP